MRQHKTRRVAKSIVVVAETLAGRDLRKCETFDCLKCVFLPI